jgi:hypothetical protein
MNIAIKTLIFGGILAGGSSMPGAMKAHSKTIVVESPSAFPQLAQRDGAAIYLHDASDGRTLLYIESKNGDDLTVLDVTDPRDIKRIARVPVAASGPFDFVQNLNASAVLVHYHNHPGYAVLDLRKYKRPLFSESPQLANAGGAEVLGTTGLLLSSDSITKDALPEPSHVSRSYNVVDTSRPSKQVLLATVAGVKQQVKRPDTGTIFLLSEDGVTVVRLLQIEERHVIDVLQNTEQER